MKEALKRFVSRWPNVLGHKRSCAQAEKYLAKNKQTKNINTTAHILLDYALIMDGEKPLNIEEFGKNMQDLIGKFN